MVHVFLVRIRSPLLCFGFLVVSISVCLYWTIWVWEPHISCRIAKTMTKLDRCFYPRSTPDNLSHPTLTFLARVCNIFRFAKLGCFVNVLFSSFERVLYMAKLKREKEKEFVIQEQFQRGSSRIDPYPAINYFIIRCIFLPIHWPRARRVTCK